MFTPKTLKVESLDSFNSRLQADLAWPTLEFLTNIPSDHKLKEERRALKEAKRNVKKHSNAVRTNA